MVSPTASLAAALSILSMSSRTLSFAPLHVMVKRHANAPKKSSHLQSIPSLIVFDLDNTLWTPELYQLRTIARENKVPVAHRDVKLFDGAHKIIQQIKSDRSNKFANTKFAVASRTKSVDWAHSLLTQFELRDVFDYVEIFPGNKDQHFKNLRRDSGIEFSDMLFFDDARDGKYGNCEPVASLGVLSVHTPNGIYEESIFHNALDHFREWSSHRSPRTIIEWDNSITVGQTVDVNQRHLGSVKFVNREKRFGFIQHEKRGQKDTFFHFNDLPSGTVVEEGDELEFTIAPARNGKLSASNIVMKSPSTSDADLVEMRTFSMNLPFAALLANGYKTIETRNGTMFTPYPEGTKMLLHVGQRIYPDGDRHIEVMKSGGLNDEEINKLKSLPRGYTKGMAVAIVELGKTYETTLEQRCEPDYQRSVAAFGQDSGMRATEIKRVEYLKQGVKVSGQGGVFKVQLERNVIPDGWLDEASSSTNNDKGYYYSATF
jgi:magnesium-dependent phosphatase 1